MVAIMIPQIRFSDRPLINPLLYLKSESRYTLPIGLRLLQQMDMTSWPLLMAGVMVMIAPIMILFVLAQRAFWVEVRS